MAIPLALVFRVQNSEIILEIYSSLFFTLYIQTGTWFWDFSASFLCACIVSFNFIHSSFLPATQWRPYHLLQRWPLRFFIGIRLLAPGLISLKQTMSLACPCALLFMSSSSTDSSMCLSRFFLSCQLCLSIFLFDCIIQFNLPQEDAPACSRKYRGLDLWGQSVSPGAAARLLGHNLPEFSLPSQAMEETGI